MTLGELIDQREQLRDQKRALTGELKGVDAQLYANEEALLEALDAAGLEHAKIDGVSVSVSEQTMPSVTDWDSLYDFIKQNDAFYMLQRRVSTGPYREMLQMEQDVPGVEPYVQRKVNMRSA
ncbi:hypothetical protein [Vreelandella massiliensis]|uniref:gp33 family protein n=1 Tax=Vreelandella massiliensis TaxID=1816686 RepID=UPI00096A995B|nr:hypothetical protein [Halomonas massiliensis]